MMILWFGEPQAMMALLHDALPMLQAQDAWLEQREKTAGWCLVCQSPVTFQVDVGVRLGTHPSLREGMVCGSCCLNNRSRLLAASLLPLASDAKRILLLEVFSPLHDVLAARLPNLLASEYFGPDRQPGEVLVFRGRPVRHESILGLSVEDGGLDLLIHNDVLEHVPDLDAALGESRRALARGGAMVFTMPFFPFLEKTQVRGRLLADGSIEHLEPPEYHGDPLSDDGVYTFFHIGMDFFDRVLAAGFSRIEAGLVTDGFLGHASNNYCYGLDGWMPAMVFRAWR